MAAKRCQLAGAFRLSVPPLEAFPLFTARGECEWVDGWRPRFVQSDADDTTVGTIFRTDHGELTTWIVTDSQIGECISYARVSATKAGTVSVSLAFVGDTGSEVTVSYDLTALTEAGVAQLADFAAGYPEFLASWEADINTALDRRREPRGSRDGR